MANEIPPIPADTPLAVTLPAGEWALWITALRDHLPVPRGRTDATWENLTRQLDEQARRAIEAAEKTNADPGTR